MPNDHSAEALCNNSDRKPAEITAHRPLIGYSEELHDFSQVIQDSRLPSKTLKNQVRWIYVHNYRSLSESKHEDEEKDKSPGLPTIPSAWSAICAKGQPSLAEIDNLARLYKVFVGKWLVFVTSDKVDNLWEKIVRSTLAGTLGISAKVSTRDKKNSSSRHVICVYTSDYRSMTDVNRVREGLRQLGVKGRIGYKPDIYTYCNIYMDNPWGILPSRYYS